MILFVLAYFGGILTILSPCILPVLPFVFARADRPFLRSGLPLLLGMAVTFAGVASLAAVGGGWAVQANDAGRLVALLLLGLFAVTLLLPAVADRLTRPVVAAGARLLQVAQAGDRPGSSLLPSFLVGIATGLLWAPCAGPILGLVLTGAALQGASVATSLLLLAYALGAATSLAVALLIGGRVFAALKRSLGAGEWLRRGLGVAVLAGVVAIASGLDTGLLTRLSQQGTASLEQALLDKVRPRSAGIVAPQLVAATLPGEGQLPSLAGAVAWLNSPPLTAESLRGKVVLVDFWTYSCINCLRALPYVQAWAQRYRDQGLVVIGVHAPEFAFERNLDNVRTAVRDLKIDYPVAIDNDYAIWRGFDNEYWPAHYFIDAQGRIRHHHFGEGDYAGSEQVIRQLLTEAGREADAGTTVSVAAGGVEAAPAIDDATSPETYVGYDRADNFASPGGLVHDTSHGYTAPQPVALNQWALAGDWAVDGEKAVLSGAGGGITYRFHARDLHLVLGPAQAGTPVHFQVRIDGAAPGGDHGVDTDDQGRGTVTSQRLYQLVRQSGGPRDRTFEIEFLDPGVQAYAFTFG
ncbi:MAG: cytochrome c biogenesis protein DipZ [Azospirillaceae bacterium]|nr:cytochrome c biogenesis protein DipZ [Azospirillaceae bacterium]